MRRRVVRIEIRLCREDLVEHEVPRGFAVFLEDRELLPPAERPPPCSPLAIESSQSTVSHRAPAVDCLIRRFEISCWASLTSLFRAWRVLP